MAAGSRSMSCGDGNCWSWRRAGRSIALLLVSRFLCSEAFVGVNLPARAALRNGALAAVRTGPRMVAMQPRADTRVERRFGPAIVAPSETIKKEGALPWVESIAGREHLLTYMPFMEWSLNTFAAQFDLEEVPVPEELALKHSIHPNKPGRITSLSFSAPEIGRARFTYFDAGAAVQVFNMVIYPESSLDVPILGIDLISFGKKHLAGVDFQPLHNDRDYLDRYVSQLAPIKARYPDLAQQMSARFYDSARFFSENMLFARFEDPEIISDKLFPAVTEYVSTYIATLKGAARRTDDASRKAVLERHRAYDQYNAERDPAHGLFVQYFGNDWSESFMDTFLFPRSVRPPEGYPKVHHGPPQQGGNCGAPSA